MDKRTAGMYSPLALAFLGDSVYEQLVRYELVLKANMPVGKLHNEAVKYVCCEFQSEACDIIQPVLTEEELDIMRRGRNASCGFSDNTASGISAPKHSKVSQYRRATSLECLFGYLYLTDNSDRIKELFKKIWDTVEI